MKTAMENSALPPESYVVEIDGNITSELKQKFPHSHIKVHDAHET